MLTHSAHANGTYTCNLGASRNRYHNNPVCVGLSQSVHHPYIIYQSSHTDTLSTQAIQTTTEHLQTVLQTFTHQSSPSSPIDNMLSLPPNPAVPTGPNGLPKPRKMRASCDACSRAKVKCDKIRPTCQRCSNINICCNYSPSMRYNLSPAPTHVPVNSHMHTDWASRVKTETLMEASFVTFPELAHVDRLVPDPRLLPE